MEKWVIRNNVFSDNELNHKLMIVINDIITEFEKLIPGGPPLGYEPIELVNDKAGPTFYWPLGRDFYKIALNICDVYYNQIAFQFSQELCRIYCDPRMRSWFIQLLSHVFGLYSLDFLSSKWEENPPNENLKDYWENFDSYKSNLINAAFSNIDIVKYQVAGEWVQYQINKLRQKDRLNRGKLLIIAYELVPLFKENPEGWKIIPLVGKYSVPPPPVNPKEIVIDRKTEPDFEKLLDNLPQEQQSFAEKFYNKLGLRIFS